MPFSLVELKPAASDEIAQFVATQTGEATSSLLERLEWLTQNPGLRDDVPFGWGVRTGGGELAGAMLCIPFRFAVGRRVEWFLMSSGFYVDASARGAGLQILLRYQSLADRFVLYTTSANAQAAALWQSTGAAPIPKTDYELLRPLRWAHAVEDVLSRRIGRTARLVASALRPVDLVATLGRRSAECTLMRVAPEDAAVTTDASDDTPTLVRDAAFIRWRYVQVPQSGAALYRVGCPGRPADVFVALIGATRGYRWQLRCTYIADVWGNVSPQLFPPVLEAVAQQQSGSTDLLSIRSFPDEYEAAARRARFRVRSFSHSIGWYIDRRRTTGRSWVMPPAGSEIV